MKRVAPVAAVIVALIGLSAAAVADENVDKAIKELEEQFAKVKSYTAKMEAMTDVTYEPGHTQKSEMVGTSEWLRQGEKALMRSDMKYKTTTTEGGQTKTTPSTITTVDDGEFLYMLREEDGKKTVTKAQTQTAQAYHPKAYFEQLKTYYDIKLLDDAKVEGHDCYVFEMKMKPMEGMPPSGRQLVYFEKDHGIQVKSESFDAEGKPNASSISKDLKIDPDINPDRFKFKIPADAEVMDTTKAQQQPAQPESEAEEAEEEPEKEPGQEEKKEEKKPFKLPKRPKLP